MQNNSLFFEKKLLKFNFIITLNLLLYVEDLQRLHPNPRRFWSFPQRQEEGTGGPLDALLSTQGLLLSISQFFCVQFLISCLEHSINDNEVMICAHIEQEGPLYQILLSHLPENQTGGYNGSGQINIMIRQSTQSVTLTDLQCCYIRKNTLFTKLVLFPK